LDSAIAEDKLEKIDAKADAALERLPSKGGGMEFAEKAKALLIMPSVGKGTLIIGIEHGKGALRIGGETVDYYSLASGSFGFQIGAQSKNLVIIFMDENALTSFRDSLGWRAGVDGSIAVIDLGAGGSVDTKNMQAPIVGFVFGLKGLMANLSLEGSKFTKISR